MSPSTEPIPPLLLVVFAASHAVFLISFLFCAVKISRAIEPGNANPCEQGTKPKQHTMKNNIVGAMRRFVATGRGLYAAAIVTAGTMLAPSAHAGPVADGLSAMTEVVDDIELWTPLVITAGGIFLGWKWYKKATNRA